MKDTYDIPRRCPVCKGELTVEALRCNHCASQLRGSFSLPRLARLPRELQEIVELLVRCRGNLKEVERKMGVSYPTVSKKLDAINLLLDATEQEDDHSARILSMIHDGEITVTEAVRELRNQRSGGEDRTGREE